MKRGGFTIIELLIVMIIMGILLVLGVVNLRSSQVYSRDNKRASDIKNIAIHLESFYTYGSDIYTTGNSYPPTLITSSDISVVRQYLRDIDTNTLTAPASDDPLTSFISATSNGPQDPLIDQYIYQPLQSDGSLCTLNSQICRKFNLYYKLEQDNMVYKVTSKHQ